MVHDLFDIFPLQKARMHEVCGAGALSFASVLAAYSSGEVLWVIEKWRSWQLNPLGLKDFIDPSRILTATSKDQAQTLAVTEETLRSGAVALVVAELTEPVTLTAGRRLQLACETGQSTCLCLVSDGMGSNAAQSRWRCTPVFDPTDSTAQRWEIIKNKSGTLGVWDVRWNKSTRRLHVVSALGQRPGSEDAPD